MPHAWNSSTLEVEVAGPEVQGQTQLYNEFNTSVCYMKLYLKTQNREATAKRASMSPRKEQPILASPTTCLAGGQVP